MNEDVEGLAWQIVRQVVEEHMNRLGLMAFGRVTEHTGTRAIHIIVPSRVKQGHYFELKQFVSRETLQDAVSADVIIATISEKLVDWERGL